MDKYNAIFREYYSHEGADCFKIRMPFTRYATETLVLCPVSDGEEKAIRLAREAVLRRVDEVLPAPLQVEEEGEPRQGGEPSGLVEIQGIRIYGFDLDPEKAWDGRIIPPHWLAMIPITQEERERGISLKDKIDAVAALFPAPRTQAASEGAVQGTEGKG